MEATAPLPVAETRPPSAATEFQRPPPQGPPGQHVATVKLGGVDTSETHRLLTQVAHHGGKPRFHCCWSRPRAVSVRVGLVRPGARRQQLSYPVDVTKRGRDVQVCVPVGVLGRDGGHEKPGGYGSQGEPTRTPMSSALPDFGAMLPSDDSDADTPVPGGESGAQAPDSVAVSEASPWPTKMSMEEFVGPSAGAPPVPGGPPLEADEAPMEEVDEVYARAEMAALDQLIGTAGRPEGFVLNAPGRRALFRSVLVKKGEGCVVFFVLVAV